MYERFTDRVRQAMQLANKDAQRLNREFIGTDNLLLGLVDANPGVATTVLTNLGVDIRELLPAVEKVTANTAAASNLPPTKRVIEFAMMEARSLNHDYVDSEHLLLGLMHDQESIACRVLMGFGLTMENVREEVTRVLGDRSH